MSNDIAKINITKFILTSKFDMKDTKVADLMLGIKIHKTPKDLVFSQSLYIKMVIEKFKYLGFKVVRSQLT